MKPGTKVSWQNITGTFAPRSSGVVIAPDDGSGVIVAAEIVDNHPVGKLARPVFCVPVDNLLNEQGPTVEEFVKAGGNPEKYPEKGYAQKSSGHEITAAIRKAKSEPAKVVEPNS